MKKNLLCLFMLIASMNIYPLYAQTIDHGGPKRMWTVPTFFSVDEEVSFYFDMTDAGFREGVDLYLWCWNPSEPDAGNWENSSDFAKLTYDGENVYHITMVPTVYFSGGTTGKSAQEIFETCQTTDWPGFWARLKTRDGGEESDVFQAPDSRTQIAEMASKSYEIYSAQFQGNTLNLTNKFTLNQPLTIVLNPDLFTVGGKVLSEVEKDANFDSFFLHSGLNDWTYQVQNNYGSEENAKLTKFHKNGNGFWTLSMTSPYDYYKIQWVDYTPSPSGLEKDTEIYNLCWLVVNSGWLGTSPDIATAAGKEEEYPDPAFSYFPSKVSAWDILTLTRQWNRKTDNELTYVITAGGRTITGSMGGSRDKREGYVNLLKELDGLNVNSISIEIKNANGITVVSTTLPLVPLSEITNE